MKITTLFFFIISFSTLLSAQELLTKSTFDNIQYVEGIEWSSDDIYCAGFSFKTAINDGNSSDAYLVNYDTKLKSKWSLKISDQHSNKINSIIRYKDKIYALVTQGKISPQTEDVFISLFTINSEGAIENKISIGRAFSSPSNIVINGSNLIFGYKVPDGITYSADSKSEIINYNLATKKLVRHKSSQYMATPKKILAEKSDIFLFGNYIHPNQPNIMAYRNGKYSEISLKSSKTEYFLDSYINKNIVTVVCAFPGVYGDMKKYLKFYYINLDNNSISSKSIPYEKLGWSDQHFDTYSTGSSSWLIIENHQTKALQYVLIDNTGKISRTLNFDRDNGNGSWERYIIREGMLLNANSSGIKIYKTD